MAIKICCPTYARKITQRTKLAVAVESTNLASKNSHVRMSLNLVKSEEIAYVEKDFPSDLAMLQTSAWVETEREAAKAHVVFLLSAVSDYCVFQMQSLLTRTVPLQS